MKFIILFIASLSFYRLGFAGQVNSRLDGIRAVFHFNEFTGQDAVDSRADVSTGATLMLGAAFSRGVFGNGVSCDGVNDHVRVVRDSNIYDFPTPSSIEFWVKIRGPESQQADIMGTGTADNEWLLYMTAGDPADVALYNNNGTPANVSVPFDFVRNEWAYIVLTYNGTTLSIYKDGDIGVNIASRIFASTSNPFRACATSGGANPANMEIDELIIWNKALTPGEVKKRYAESRSAFIVNQ